MQRKNSNILAIIIKFDYLEFRNILDGVFFKSTYMLLIRNPPKIQWQEVLKIRSQRNNSLGKC